MNYKIFIKDFALVKEFQSVYSSEFVHSYWSGPCTIYMVRFTPIVLNIENKWNDVMYDGLFTCVKHLLTNRLRGKATEHSL